MKNKFLGIISVTYFYIILYVIFSNKLKLFLAPNLQIYIKFSMLPLFLISVIVFSNNNNNYKFKISDLILFLPLIMMFFVGDGSFSKSFAKNRMVNYVSKVDKKEKVETKTENNLEENKNNDNNELVENTDNEEIADIFFDINDKSYSALASYLSFSEKSKIYEGKTIRVKGFTIMNESYIPNGYFALGKYEINCCAADAEFTGFYVKYDTSKIKEGLWYEIEGFLKLDNINGNNSLVIQPKTVKEIDSKSEEEYVYPCYSYDDGSCKEISKYNIEY